MSNKKIAKALGVNPSTVDRDVAAANAADAGNKPNKTKGTEKPPAANAAGGLTGAAAAAAVASAETKDERKAAKDEQREEDAVENGVGEVRCPLQDEAGVGNALRYDARKLPKFGEFISTSPRSQFRINPRVCHRTLAGGHVLRR